MGKIRVYARGWARILNNNQSCKAPQEVTEKLLEVDQPNIPLSLPVNGSCPCILDSSMARGAIPLGDPRLYSPETAAQIEMWLLRHPNQTDNQNLHFAIRCFMNSHVARS